MDESERHGPNGLRLRAAALAYDPRRDSAPRLVGKGGGSTAEKLLSIAELNGIPVHQDPGLLDFLMRVDLEERIPYELYIAVAAVLSMVYAAAKTGSAVHPPEQPKRK